MNMNKRVKHRIILSVFLIIMGVMTILLTACGSDNDFSFKYWNEDSEALATLQDFVNDVCDEDSENFVPVEDRIAVFDMDGTLYCETAPAYLEEVLFVYRVLEDENYKASQELTDYAKKLNEDMSANFNSVEFSTKNSEAFSGMTIEEYDKYVKDFINNTEAPGCNGLTYAEVFFQPMLEIVDYLNANDFTTYVCSGTERATVRALIDGHVNIKGNNAIGYDIAYLPDGYKGEAKSNETYEYTYDDEMVRSDEVMEECLEGHKTNKIATQIGRQPILIFGNSMGDASMATYATDENPYKAMAFMLKADDPSKVKTNLEAYEERAEYWEKNDWTIISMKNDFKALFIEAE